MLHQPPLHVGGERVTFGDYTVLASVAESDAEPVDIDRETAFRPYSVYLRSEEAVKRVLGQAMWAYRDADNVEGIFPAVVYAPSQSGSAFDNAVLCEYLASHGYVVASVASKGPFSRRMPMTAAGVEAQTRDLEFLAGYLQSVSFADRSRISTVGFSLGGLSNVTFAIRFADVDAIVSFDGTIGSPIGYEILNQLPNAKSDDLRTPFLMFAGDKLVKGRFTFYNEIRFSDAHLLKVRGINHLQFSSFNLMFSQQGETALAAYRSMCAYTVAFLDHYAGDADTPFVPFTDDVTPDEFEYYEHRSAEKAPPSEDMFFSIIENEGVDRGIEVYYEVKPAFPEYIMFEYRAFRDVGWKMHIDGNYPSAIKLFEILVDAFPDNADRYNRLGQAHMESGNDPEALKHLRKGLTLDPESNALKQTID